MSDTKDFLLRIPAELAEELEQAHWLEHQSMTEIVLQGLVIRLRMPGKSKLPALLEKLGYQPRRKAGRPALDREQANGHEPEQAPAEDSWSLDTVPS